MPGSNRDVVASAPAKIVKAEPVKLTAPEGVLNSGAVALEATPGHQFVLGAVHQMPSPDRHTFVTDKDSGIVKVNTPSCPPSGDRFWPMLTRSAVRPT